MSSSSSTELRSSTEPPSKKAKTLSVAGNLLQFFGSQTRTSSSLSSSPGKEKPKPCSASASSAEKNPKPNDYEGSTGNNNTKGNDNSSTKNKASQASNSNKSGIPGPIIPTLVTPNPKYQWIVVDESLLIRQLKPTSPFQRNGTMCGTVSTVRNKVAAFDMDGTLLLWRVAQWPSRLDQYELWSSTVIAKLQHLFDHEQYHLVLFTNQGGIRGAFTGKKAMHVKSLIEWLAQQIDRPLLVLASTKSKEMYHKPSPKMFDKAEAILMLNNDKVPLDLEQSFYVGDSVIRPDDPQGGVDEKFAAAVGQLRGCTLKFYEPQDYFGPGDASRRQGLLSSD